MHNPSGSDLSSDRALDQGSKREQDSLVDDVMLFIGQGPFLSEQMVNLFMEASVRWNLVVANQVYQLSRLPFLSVLMSVPQSVFLTGMKMIICYTKLV